MQRDSSDERIGSSGSSPRLSNKSTKFFGLLTKRSTKVEPHPLHANQTPTKLSAGSGAQNVLSTEQNISFAKCTPDKHKLQQDNHVGSNSNTSKASKIQPLPHDTHNLDNSQSSIGMIGWQRRALHPTSRSKSTASPNISETQQRRNYEEGSQSDGGEVIMRKSPKHRTPNHNRFSHQFSLCCRAEKKPLTPPVTVRYNSIPDSNNVLRRDTLSLSWNVADNISSSLQSYDMNNTIQLPPLPVPCLPPAPAIAECVSAPQSPVAVKSLFSQQQFTYSSLSDSSSKSIQSESPNNSRLIRGPIHPIPVSACRSRLRLKLYPPNKEFTPLNSGAKENVIEKLKRATTPQHMSSPNISIQPEISSDRKEAQNIRFMSHENIQMKRESSSLGLARQALMSAQVLNLIPTEKARERSFLDGHLGSSSLLGPSELIRVLPNKEITIFVGTWNMNGQSPPKQMNDFVLPVTVEHVPDIVAIGTQESSPDRFEWEVTIQETLGPSHVLFHSTVLGTLHLAIYMRRDLIWYCSAPEDASFSVRTGSAFRTKGAVAIGFCLFGTSMLFVTSHLTAHQQKVKERVSDVKRIIHALDLPRNLNLRHKNKDVTQNFDNVFWCGDLNFRLSEPREKLLEWIQNTKFPLPLHLPHGYMHTDQLSSVLSDGAAFRGFMEANITFPPTYKYDPGTQFFDTSAKQRAPAYTDRILYKYRQTQGLTLRRQSMAPSLAAGASTSVQPYVQCLLYDSVPSITTSDHKPVVALFKTSIRAGTDSIPLAAGLFSRDIYLEGMKRRLNNKYSGSSAVCAIQ